MLQLQYLNSKLSKAHIDSILNNFNIKYTTVKNEIDAKVNGLLKLFMGDISSFLENLEEISQERKKLKDFENIQREYDILSNKFKEKSINERKLENDIVSLQKEILFLKNENKIKIKNLELLTSPVGNKKNDSSKNNRKIQTKHMTIKSGPLMPSYINNNKNKKNIDTKKIADKKRQFLTSRTKANRLTSPSIENKKSKILSNSKKKDKPPRSPDLLMSLNKKRINDNVSQIGKTIQNMKKKYPINSYNERIKKMNIGNKKKNINGKGLNKPKITREFKSSSLVIRKGKVKEIIKEQNDEEEKDDDSENKGDIEVAEHFLKLVDTSTESHRRDSINYSKDCEKSITHNISNKKIDIINHQNTIKNFSPYDNDDDNENQSIDNELEELEKDENDILFLMSQIKNISVKT